MSGPAATAETTPSGWSGTPGVRELLFLAVSLAGFFAVLPVRSWPVYILTFAAVYAIGVSGLERRWRLISVLLVLAAYLFFERQLPRPQVPFVLWSGRGIRAFFLLRAIDFALSKPRRELSSSTKDRVFQFLLFVTFLPCLFAGPVVLFNDFYRQYAPASFLERRSLVRHLAKIAWGAVKFYAIAPYTAALVRNLHNWSHAGGDPYNMSPHALAWGYMLAQVVDILIRFSGFTDIAIGVSRILGFQLDENFRMPLLARTPMEYWKSMHISAYKWLMTHVFYPTWGHRQLLLKIETTFLVSMIWHFSIVTRPGPHAAAQLFSAGLLYGSGVWLVATFASRPRQEQPPRRSKGELIAIRSLQTAATFVFISFVNLIFHAGLTSRPIAETVSDVRLIMGAGTQRFSARVRESSNAAMPVPASFIRTDQDHLNELISDVQVSGLDGRGVRLSRFLGEHGAIVVTIDPSCAVFQQYVPRIAELEQAETTSGYPFLFVDVRQLPTNKGVRRELSELGFRGRHVRDNEGRLTAALGARTSAEVFVLDAKRTLVYRGAIDDQFGEGFAHDEAQRPYLTAALEDLRVGRPVRVPATAAPGCSLGSKAKAKSLAAASQLTYHQHVSRIVQAHCVVCHRAGGAGPFPLDSYDQVVSHQDRIRVVLQEGRMPPWFAAPGNGPWANDPTLTATERNTLFSWLDQGASVGDSADAPVRREFRDGWDIGTPDMVLSLPTPQQIPRRGVLPYRYASIDVELPAERWVQAVQIRTTAGSNLHHVLAFLEQPTDNPMAMPDTVSEGGTGHVDEARHGLTSYFALYSPGTVSAIYPPGSAKRLPRRIRVVFQLHYLTTGTPAVDSLRMGVVFASSAPRFEVVTSSGYNKDFTIPPMDPHYPVSGSFEFQESGLLLSFLPHMHYRGRAFRYELVAPDGTKRTLLEVPRYGFNWQVSYNLATPVPVSRGSRIIATGWFDNSPNNPENPDPTRAVKFGMQSTEEMMIGYFDWVPSRPAVQPTRAVTAASR